MGGWGGRDAQRHARELRARQLPCCLCGRPIDYTLTSPDPDSFSVEHLQARSLRPDLTHDPRNMGAAHLRCNQQRSNRTIRNADVGRPSAAW